VHSLSVFALNLVTGLGLGLAIDYSLFIVSRWREEAAVHGHGPEALAATMRSAGRTVFFSAVTVAASMSCLLVFPQQFLYSMGLGGVLVALAAGLVALVPLPAFLYWLGPRIDSLAPRRLQQVPSGGRWGRLAVWVMRRPGRIAAISATFLIVLALPALGVNFVGVDATTLPSSASSRQVAEALDREGVRGSLRRSRRSWTPHLPPLSRPASRRRRGSLRCCLPGRSRRASGGSTCCHGRKGSPIGRSSSCKRFVPNCGTRA
jgi:RND superfamily putative drug exporter